MAYVVAEVSGAPLKSNQRKDREEIGGEPEDGVLPSRENTPGF
jgi:hypothetical protein